MQKPKLFGWNRRAAFLIMLALVFASLIPLGPTRTYAYPCCGWKVTTNYYSDESHTTWVGRCVDSDCTGYSCTGEQTDFYTVSIACCERCIP